MLADYRSVLAYPGLIPAPRWTFLGPSTPAPRASPPARPGLRLPVGAISIRSDAPPGTLAMLLDRLYDRGNGVEHQPDPALHSALWAGDTPFGTRRQAYDLVGASGQPTGSRAVNVVIVDQGFDRVPFQGSFDGGFATPGRPKPGTGRSEHAAAMARTVLELAPAARLYDAPLIPLAAPGARDTIGNIPAFTLDAYMLWFEMLRALDLSGTGPEPASWVIVNAWSVPDRATDRGMPRYTTDRDHMFNWIVRRTVEWVRADTVFAAGNCGQFAPDARCGATDRGSGRSITGANSLDCVLTVGAVRTDGTWLGYSGQGPGQPSLGPDKPDACAPSGFAEDFDAGLTLSGTSGAAAVAGGIVARLRGEFDQGTVAPDRMKDALRRTAQKRPEPPARVGQGILQAAAAAACLKGP